MGFCVLAALLLTLTVQGQEAQRETHKKTVLIVRRSGKARNANLPRSHLR